MTLDQEREAIRAELETLRQSGARRQDLSLHACKRLFFDLGIRPSMATVRDLTRVGSASDIPKDIEHFWERVREVSRVRVGAGAIPKALEDRAGELLGALFDEALAQARTTMESERAQMHAAIDEAQQRARDADVRHQTIEEALQRSEAKADAAWERIRVLESERTQTSLHGTARLDTLQAAALRLEAENEALRKRLDTEQSTNTDLRNRIDELHVELRQHTEHYAQQIKDAISEAERRVKPMLVELDSLRNMASTYQSGVKEASRKEFEFIQQLAAAKARGDRLDAQLREQSDELDALNGELATLRAQQRMDPAVASLLCVLANAGRLSTDELAMIGTAADGHVAVPKRCPKCEDGEPELSQVDDRYEIQCPDCEHASGPVLSRLEAVARFLSDKPAQA